MQPKLMSMLSYDLPQGLEVSEQDSWLVCMCILISHALIFNDNRHPGTPSGVHLAVISLPNHSHQEFPSHSHSDCSSD